MHQHENHSDHSDTDNHGGTVHAAPDADQSQQDFWEEFYGSRDQVWSGRPNGALIREVASLPAGTALDLGCAEGGDAIWLAERGWQVTAVDVSRTALDRAVARAESAGVGERIAWEQHDLAEAFPVGTFDLVTAMFFHSPVGPARNRDEPLRQAAAAVAPGGMLLIVSHTDSPEAHQQQDRTVVFQTSQEILDGLELDPDGWDILKVDTVARPAGEHGLHGHFTDSIVKLRRR